MNTQELFATIEEGLHEHNDYADGQTPYHNYRKSGLEALATLRQWVMDLDALSDAVQELKCIEVAYTRLPDNTWPEWDDAYENMYTINKRIRESNAL